MDWTDETIARLRALWDEGHSTAEVGRRLGVTKNAVVGKAHRLNLPARPSPIRRSTGEARTVRRAPRRTTGPTLPVLAAALIPAAPRPVEAKVAPAVRPVPAATRPAGRRTACSWPLGEPGTPSFGFCGEHAIHGKPYCPGHAAIAYVKVRDRREDAA
jgi:GcrA cell cycle regulator